MSDKPLLLEACQAGAFGEKLLYAGGAVYEAGFVYLDGEPDAGIMDSLLEKWKCRQLVCLSEAWEKTLLTRCPSVYALTRHRMGLPEKGFDRERLSDFTKDLPEGFEVMPFDERAFEKAPFGHGRNYESWKAFKERGSGAVVRTDGIIAASASGFLTFGQDIELDISTRPEYRRRGLGIACAAAMILDCINRGLSVHWDAQNDASRRMAEKLGYGPGEAYTAYCFIQPDE